MYPVRQKQNTDNDHIIEGSTLQVPGTASWHSDWSFQVLHFYHKPSLAYVSSNHISNFFMPPNQPQIVNPASERSSKCFQGVCICSVTGCSKTPSESLAHQLQNSPHWNGNKQHHIIIDISTLERQPGFSLWQKLLLQLWPIEYLNFFRTSALSP